MLELPDKLKNSKFNFITEVRTSKNLRIQLLLDLLDLSAPKMKRGSEGLLYLAIGVASLLVTVHGEVPEGVYRIENLDDGLHITTEGANTAFARVVGENWQNFREQRWKLAKSGTGLFSLTSEKHSTNNALSYYRDATVKYAVPENWSIIQAQNGYQIQNQRTGLCLVSSGRRKEIVEGKCDRYLPDRHWSFKAL